MFTIDGVGDFCRSGSAAREQKNVPSSTMPTTALQPFGVIFSAGETKLPAALFTRTSRRPYSDRTASKSRSTCSGIRTSVGTSRTRAPFPRSSAAPAAKCSSDRLAIARLNPSWASAEPIARPIPVPPPVISATGLASFRGVPGVEDMTNSNRQGSKCVARPEPGPPAPLRARRP
jgi:hypothetical protein